MEDPLWVYLTWHQVLAAVDDSVAHEPLKRAYNILQAKASDIEEIETRQSFLENVPYNREIVAAYERWAEVGGQKSEVGSRRSEVSERVVPEPDVSPVETIKAQPSVSVSPQVVSSPAISPAPAEAPAPGYQPIDLSHALLSGSKLIGAMMNGIQLRGADLSQCDLRGANLVGADLRGANLANADLRGADLQQADLRGANLTGAALQGVDFLAADLRGADLTSVAFDEMTPLAGWDESGGVRLGAVHEPQKTVVPTCVGSNSILTQVESCALKRFMAESV